MKIISEKSHNSVKIAADILRSGKAIAFASDTVYGVAVDAANPIAVELLYKLKKRDPKKPIAVFLANVAMAKDIFYFDEISEKIAEEFMPGSLTLVLKQRSESSSQIAPNLNSDAENFLGFRVIDREFVNKLLVEFGGIIAVTSANLAGFPAATNAAEVKEYFSPSDLDLIIDGGELAQQNISTVVRVNNQEITILRHGVVSEFAIKSVIKKS